MPEAGQKEIRLYCVCGQRMKISGDMFGRKGKCIACRQKLRVPYLDEIPEGTDKVYLKEHPEFLRKPYLAGHAAAAARIREQQERPEYESIIVPGDFVKPVMDSDGEESSPGLAGVSERVLPLDDYEPLRALCSLEYKLEKERAEKARPEAELCDLEKRLHEARAKFEMKLRDRVKAVSLELDKAREELIQHCMDLRIGKIGYAAYRAKVRPARHRREGFARLHHNLRAWLQVRDPYSAGGYMDVPGEAVPSAFPLPHPEQEPIPDDIALNRLLGDMRAAFRARAQADRQLEDCQRKNDGGVLSGAELEEARATATAAKARARARLAYARERIAESENDFENDAKALRANLELAEDDFRAGKLSGRAHNALKADLEQGLRDNELARDLARRALSANSAEDVPSPRGTFFSRLVNTPYVKDLGADSWVGLAAAIALTASTFLPFTPLSNNWAMMQEFCGGLLLAALLMAAASLIKKQKLRTGLFTLVWVLLCLGTAWYLHELRFMAGPLGDIVRADARWFARPGLLALILGVALIGTAGSLATTSRRRVPLTPIFGMLIIAAGIALIVTHFAGLLKPALNVEQPISEPANALQTLYRVTVPIENTGTRAVWLVHGDTTAVPYPATYALGRRSAAQNSSANRSRPEAVQRGDGAWTVPEENIAVDPGERIAFRYQLAPGAYQFTLDSNLVKGLPKTREFEIQAPPQPAVPPAHSPKPISAAPPEPNLTGPVKFRDYIQLELQGVVNNADGDPTFSINVQWPDGAQERWRIELNQVVFGPWRAQEYNPEENSITFSNGEALRILKKGETLNLALQ